ncbi:hypothetical protein EIP91_008806 [Steccherinum ochraceum]|uniref:Signal recognition particle subunit SRP68 n=1 Tax=Steccherinum ochraceum TaxID=92696 RepID=A0A4R0R2C0_9APHY|nr:hypothetical protein EIP91_008806 [Steccherinum ochraceum]
MTDATLQFRALLLANEQRNAYGLRSNDFERYRKHCANRTHRLRTSLKMTHGKGREFKKLPPVKTENIKDGYLQLLLFEAERAWAYSRELTTLASSNAEKASALKRNATSRFRRAVNWATQLLSHCQSLYDASRLSAESLIQVTVYTLILNGRFLSSRYEYDDALTQLSVARSLLDELANRAVTSRDQALATAFADEIGPEIRYCAHELSRSKAYDVDGIVSEVASQQKNDIVVGHDALVNKLVQESAGGVESERKKLKPILWDGEAVPVRNPELVDVLLRVQHAEEKLADGQGEKKVSDEGENKKERVGKGTKSKRGVAAYDAILLALSEAEDVARRLVEAQQLSAGTTTSPAGTRDTQFVHAYIIYQLLSRRIQRDLLLITTLIHQSQTTAHPHSQGASKKGKAASTPSWSQAAQQVQVDARLFPAIVKLLDTIIQSLNQMRTLSVVDDSPDLASAVDARIAFTKARRCRYLARCYTPLKKYAEALTLTQHGALHLREARQALSLLPPSPTDPAQTEDPINTAQSAFYPLSTSDVSLLDDELSADSLQCKKDWFTFNGGQASSDPASTKAHKKPLFFDIALNYVQLDMERLQERAGKAPGASGTEAPRGAAASAPATKAPEVSHLQPPQQQERKTLNVVGKTAKVEAAERERSPTPEPSAQAARGLGGLLGGWWGRK